MKPIFIPFTPNPIQRAIELLYESLAEFEVPEEDAEAVVQSVARYERDLLAQPEDTDQ